MPSAPSGNPDTTPETLLQMALEAKSTTARWKYACMGLSSKAPLDKTTQTLLLRQLYLVHYERADFEKALEIARQMIDLDVLVDVTQQDAARALIALGEVDKAVEALRLAARNSPARRRAFHQWTLGSVLYLAGNFEEAEHAMLRAIRWATTDRSLYDAHLALIRIDSGQSVDDLPGVIERLEEASCGKGYGKFLLGMLCARAGRQADAVLHLRSFLKKTEEGRKATALSLAGELAAAQKELSRCAS